MQAVFQKHGPRMNVPRLRQSGVQPKLRRHG
jgi:hypothetical protein